MLDILLLWYPTKRERQTVDHQYEVYFSRRFESPDKQQLRQHPHQGVFILKQRLKTKTISVQMSVLQFQL